MDESAGIPAFEGSVPEVYDSLLVPMIFESYATDLVDRLADVGPASVLEIAAGSGVLTRAMAARLPDTVSIVATDLAPPMLARAQAVGTAREVEWRQADAMALPFPDDAFEMVVCQFGVMFFPHRLAAFAEVARVLRPGGRFLFSTWGPVALNEFAETVEAAVATLFPERPPTFVSDIPHGYFDEDTIRADLVAAGFTGPVDIERVDRRSRASGPDEAATAYCLGTPLRGEIEGRDPGALDAAVTLSSAALAERFGGHDLDGLISGLVVTASTTGGTASAS